MRDEKEWGKLVIPETIQQALLKLSHELGRPEHDYVILGEGNTSVRIDEGSFLVKASGTNLATLRDSGLVRVSSEACRKMLIGPELNDHEITAALLDARVDPAGETRPSVETVMHAVLLDLPGVNFVGHTHPTAINAINCSPRFDDALTPRLFPDHIVVCGPSAALVPYVDPGLPLARAVIEIARAYLDRFGEAPKTIYLKNHGFIALGSSAMEVSQVTAMAVKAARILLGAFAAGGPIFMSDADVSRIAGRDDEHYRQQVLRDRQSL